MSARATHSVYNLTQGYTEHVGSLSSCQDWLRNIRDCGFTSDRFEIRPRTVNR